MAISKRSKSVKKSRKTTNSKRNAKKKAGISREQAHKYCEELMGKKIAEVEYPGGRSRESWRIIFNDTESVIATRRKNPFRANLEMKVLKALEKHNVSSPRLLETVNWQLFLQQDLKGERLSKQIISANEQQAEQLLGSALDGLSQAQMAASNEMLDLQMPIIGAKKDWIIELLQRPYPIGEFFDIPAPKLDMKSLYQLFRVRKPRFVKWDSRPGNAVVLIDGTVAWYDWEHAGSRNRLDDVAWLLADEFVPDYPDVERRLLEKHLLKFADESSFDTAKTYLMAYGTFHMLIRLGLILSYKTKDDKSWWDINYCIKKDKIGITLECAKRTCLRASRWARYSSLTEDLSPWLKQIASRLDSL